MRFKWPLVLLVLIAPIFISVLSGWQDKAHGGENNPTLFPLADGGSCHNTTLLYEEALRMKPPKDIIGVKRNAYALLHDVNMYIVTGDGEYRRLAETHGRHILERQRADGVWEEVEGEPTSSYALLETVTATWALSDAYRHGILTGSEVEEAILRGGDALTAKADHLTFFGYKIGLKPNAVGFLVIGLAKAGEGAEAIGKTDKADLYRSNAIDVGRGLVSMQLEDGAWYDGPYRLPTYRGWRDVSAWYHGMALSGVSAAYSVSTGGDAWLFKHSAASGIAFYSEMKRAGGGYYGVLHPDGRAEGNGDIMVLQAYAIGESYGLPGDCGVLNKTASEVKSWDANYAYALSQLLVNEHPS